MLCPRNMDVTFQGSVSDPVYAELFVVTFLDNETYWHLLSNLQGRLHGLCDLMDSCHKEPQHLGFRGDLRTSPKKSFTLIKPNGDTLHTEIYCVAHRRRVRYIVYLTGSCTTHTVRCLSFVYLNVPMWFCVRGYLVLNNCGLLKQF